MSDTVNNDSDPATSAFAPNEWSASDIAGLLPTNLPTKRIARAWERQPHCPFATGNGSRKVWRRVRMPKFGGGGGGGAMTSDRGFARPTRQELDQPVKARGLSPKKAVKKLCVQNTFGREWRMTEFERPRGDHTRKSIADLVYWDGADDCAGKLASRPPIVLRSGTVLDPDFEGDEPIKHNDAGSADDDEEDEDYEEGEHGGADLLKAYPRSEPSTSVVENNNITDDEWEDVESEEDVDMETIEETSRDPSESLDEQDEDEESRLTEVADDNAATLDEQSTTTIAQASAPSTTEAVDSPFSEQERTSPAKSSAKNSSLEVPSIVTRASSAPARETISKEERSRPRLSDDTAILHAFLSRAAANKKPAMARRESLTNRRDSGMIRQALASPAKPEVLAERDTNSPLPQKAMRSDSGEDSADSCEKAEKAESPSKADSEEEHRPTRRSSRSRAKPSLLLDQMTVPAKTVPNKITIRGTMDAVPLKRSEVQGLAAQTRSNTRKNKGQSVMPLLRLSKLVGEVVASESQAEDAGSESSGNGKNVRWDETLEYFSKAPGETGDAEKVALGTSAAQETDTPSSPDKGRSSRRTRVKIDTPTATPTVQQQQQDQPQPESSTAPSAPPKATPLPAPSKRRSRIATPAKGLLSRSALLPDGLASDDPEPPKPSAPAAAKKPAPTRAIPTPKRVPQQQQHSVTKPPARPSSPAKKPAPGPPANPVFAPRLDPARPLQSLSFEDALVRDAGKKSSVMKSGNDDGPVPGLSSPAKRPRRGFVIGVNGSGAIKAREREREDVVPGLMSPAKKRRG
ncbi:hypothetical protein ANO11243_058180 [Dothideomycetidae sp. 11243]|nr:hypothetical protein ANO11243_058180 [fungal sp. No.11243]